MIGTSSYSGTSIPREKHLEPFDQNFLFRLNQTIDEHMNDSCWDVMVLAKKLGVSRRTLYRKVQHLLGIAPATYVRACRLEKAAVLLRSGKFSTVAEVSNHVGLSQEHLTRLYKKRFGTSPGKDLCR